MRLSDLHYELPPELIAQEPVRPRDASRLLVVRRETGELEHARFRDIGAYLRPGDCLILNDTRVVPARFMCRRGTGGRVEALYLRQDGEDWRLLLRPSARLKAGETITAEAGGLRLTLGERYERGEWSARPAPAVEAVAWLTRHGEVPLPPYIGRDEVPRASDREDYQTVYAEAAGAVAAPTAGLHFTHALLRSLCEQGVGTATVTLHVGVGTFSPIDVDDLTEHVMHREWFSVSGVTLDTLAAVRREGGRLVAVGTTAARVLESLPGRVGAADGPAGDRRGWTDLFVYPPYEFRNVDVLVTNFHLPGSTLLALVMAFASPELVRRAYAAAVEERYRFYSYGDAMLLL